MTMCNYSILHGTKERVYPAESVIKLWAYQLLSSYDFNAIDWHWNEYNSIREFRRNMAPGQVCEYWLFCQNDRLIDMVFLIETLESSEVTHK